MRQKGGFQVGFLVKAIICFMDSDVILAIIIFIIFPTTKLSEFFGSSVLLAASSLPLCKDII